MFCFYDSCLPIKKLQNEVLSKEDCGSKACIFLRYYDFCFKGSSINAIYVIIFFFRNCKTKFQTQSRGFSLQLLSLFSNAEVGAVRPERVTTEQALRTLPVSYSLFDSGHQRIS
jgi:hypothetical protein